MTTTSIDFGEVAPAGIVPLRQVAVRLHADDNIAIARVNLPAGTILDAEAGGSAIIRVSRFIPAGHKVALRPAAPGQPLYRYGQLIGFATHPITPGDHVHSHNLGVGDFARDYAFGQDVRPVDYIPAPGRRSFAGYRRPDGRVGTRNYVAVISSVNCSAHTTREIARYFTPERLAAYPNVDGVIALAHSIGCSTRVGGEDYLLLQRTLAGMARHPNVGAYVMVGLGCEVNQISALVETYSLDRRHPAPGFSVWPPSFTIQDSGGIRKTIEAGITAVEQLLPLVNASQRTPQPAAELVLALQCGGSDTWSGVTANPVVGWAADETVRQGGTVVLAETPEIYGAEHLLTRRAISREVGQKLVDQVRWWEAYAQKMEMEIDNNPTPGNKAGGLTTIYEKSLGAIAKGGVTPLTGVYDYAEPVTARGFTFMDTPGYDPVGVTGQVAGGCNLVLFTTGRGSAFGFKPAPSLKICSNSAVYEQMPDDMDLNAGRVLEGVTLEEMGAELFELVLAVASGQPSKSEAQGVGEAEFNPWSRGGPL